MQVNYSSKAIFFGGEKKERESYSYDQQIKQRFPKVESKSRFNKNSVCFSELELEFNYNSNSNSMRIGVRS